jgi:ABC-type transport system involved in cytochrome c biogenesis permease subunit
MMHAILHCLSLLSYVTAAIFYGANLTLRSRRHLISARTAFVVALLLQTAGIGAFCITTHQSPFASTYGTLSVTAWIIAILYLPVEFQAHVPALGALASPAEAVLLFMSLLKVRSGFAGSPAVRTQIINIHVFLVLISLALFAIAACCAVFYIWQYGVLKHPDKRAMFRRLPPLETVDAIAYHLVAFGFPLLTIGLILGFVRAAAGVLHGNWLLDPHTLISIAAWLVYSGYLFARLFAGWRGTRLNYLLIAGLVVTLALFFIPSSTHRFT